MGCGNAPYLNWSLVCKNIHICQNSSLKTLWILNIQLYVIKKNNSGLSTQEMLCNYFIVIRRTCSGSMDSQDTRV